MSQWEVVIGLETHTQLQTKSKIFSGASTAFGAEPNVQACAVDIALPGVLPVLNREAVVCAIKLGLSVGAEIAPRSIFARKNYFYPDLPKGYQISQFEIPVVSGGGLTIQVEGREPKFVRLTRAHLEEDAGKSLHEDFDGKTGIDLNRAGTPLLEIVSEPDMSSAAEAVAYAKALHGLVTWIGICDGNMQEGSFRCDANVSVRRPGEPLGTRREIKNLNSFRFLEQAINYEIQWQIGEIEDGRKIQQATVLFDPDTGETRAMRSKEDAQDYRYFPDPDLLPLEIKADWIAEVKGGLPELPSTMQQRFQNDYGLSAYDAVTLTASLPKARYFESAVTKAGKENAKLCANWVMGEIFRRTKSTLDNLLVEIEGQTRILDTAQSVEEHLGQVDPKKLSDESLFKLESALANWSDQASLARAIGCHIFPHQLADLVIRIADGTVSNSAAKQVFETLWKGEGETVDAIIEAKGLKQITDTGAIEAIIDEVLAANQKSVEEFRAGKDKAFNALVGQAMKATKGKANPQQVNELLKKKLGA